jgi:hypothetical protein
MDVPVSRRRTIHNIGSAVAGGEAHQTRHHHASPPYWNITCLWIMQPISKVIGSSYWSCWSIRSLSQPKGKYYDHMGRTRYVLEEKASDIFDRGLGENWFLCGWAMRATVDAIVTRQQAGHGNRSDKTAKNRTAFQVQNGWTHPFSATKMSGHRRTAAQG